jgi:lipopolysaccharide/colanic/teichoic acid biosynthesis glycosyltransferase
MDLVISITLLLLFSWLFFSILLGYFVTWNFPIIFNQKRAGRNEEPFLMLKFRTLSSETDRSLNERRFSFGDFLRATSLDELPQLLNVLKGDMSFIGPRPLPVEYLPLYSIEQKRRHTVRPGVTGWAQVNGRNSIQWREKFQFDNYYVNNVSFTLDLAILFKTIILLLSFKKDVSLSEKPFMGN